MKLQIKIIEIRNQAKKQELIVEVSDSLSIEDQVDEAAKKTVKKFYGELAWFKRNEFKKNYRRVGCIYNKLKKSNAYEAVTGSILITVEKI